jgi:hypothetical protein
MAGAAMNWMLRARNPIGELNGGRLVARVLVVLGGLFWVFVALGAQRAAYTEFVYTLPEFARGALIALIPLVSTVGAFVLGIYYERLTGLLLLIASVAMIVWGVIAHWGETVLWMTAISVLIAPAAFAGAFYLLAARTQELHESRAMRG